VGQRVAERHRDLEPEAPIKSLRCVEECEHACCLHLWAKNLTSGSNNRLVKVLSTSSWRPSPAPRPSPRPWRGVSAAATLLLLACGPRSLCCPTAGLQQPLMALRAPQCHSASAAPAACAAARRRLARRARSCQWDDDAVSCCAVLPCWVDHSDQGALLVGTTPSAVARCCLVGLIHQIKVPDLNTLAAGGGVAPLWAAAGARCAGGARGSSRKRTVGHARAEPR
jgi:hypothetical protein